MIDMIGGLLSGVLKIGDKLIVDKDKKVEFAFKVQEMAHELALKLLEAKTYPWVDALVKLAYASEALIKGLFRPAASTAAMVFVAYCEMKGIELSQMTEAVMVSLLPAWGVSRYKEKQKKREAADGELGW